MRFLNERAKVFAYEAEGSNLALMKENLKRNRVRGVVAKNLAVSEGGGMRKFYINEDSHNHSLVRGDWECVEVGSVAFSDLLDRYGEIDLVKMDIEGAEFEIFRSLDLGKLKGVGTLYVEYHEYEGKVVELKEILGKVYGSVRVFPSKYDNRMGIVLAR